MNLGPRIFSTGASVSCHPLKDDNLGGDLFHNTGIHSSSILLWVNIPYDSTIYICIVSIKVCNLIRRQKPYFITEFQIHLQNHIFWPLVRNLLLYFHQG